MTGAKRVGRAGPALTVMRALFHGELEQLGVELATMCGLAAAAMENATRSMSTPISPWPNR